MNLDDDPSPLLIGGKHLWITSYNREYFQQFINAFRDQQVHDFIDQDGDTYRGRVTKWDEAGSELLREYSCVIELVV